MNNEIIEKLNKIQGILDTDISYMSIALLEERDSDEDVITYESFEGIEDFLWIKNKYEYMRFGEVLFWVDDEKFKEHQNDIIMYGVPNKKEYICIGEVEPYPILLNKVTGVVYCVLNELGEKCNLKEYCDFKDFFNQYVIGEKYLEFGSSKKWNDFMKQYGII